MSPMFIENIKFGGIMFGFMLNMLFVSDLSSKIDNLAKVQQEQSTNHSALKSFIHDIIKQHK